MEIGNATNQATRGQIYGGAALGSVAAAPLSPVRAQMHRQQELLSDLRQQHNALCDALMPVMAHDPRDPVPTTAGSLKEGSVPSCDFERELLMQNEDLQNSIRRLREINGVIRL
jgi:hypothetical protein